MRQHDEINKALFGKRTGGRIRVCPPEERTADNIVFASKREMQAYQGFKILLHAGTFTDLKLQVRYPVFVTDPRGKLVKIFDYVADFVVTDRDGVQEIMEAKGMRTEVYKIKKRAVEAQYGIRIVEV